MLNKNVIIIPARYQSTRFPGKPLALIKGHSLIYRVWSLAKAIKGVDEVYIATDHIDIQKHALGFGAKALMTENSQNGTERCYAALSLLRDKPEIILNLQGDAVLTPPWVIQALIDTMNNNSQLEITTLATQINKEKYSLMQKAKAKGEVGGTMVVCDKDFNAMYFSKSMIPYLRNTQMEPPPLYRHIGLYAYRYSALKSYIAAPSTPLEKLEGLEQLRVLENGKPIRVVLVDYKGHTHASVDSPEDIVRIEKLIEAEGELVAL